MKKLEIEKTKPTIIISVFCSNLALVFSIQYDFEILKQYQYQNLKDTEVSVFSISIFS